MNMSDCDSGDFAHAATVLSAVATTAAAITILHEFSDSFLKDDTGTIHLLVVLGEGVSICTRNGVPQNSQSAWERFAANLAVFLNSARVASILPRRILRFLIDSDNFLEEAGNRDVEAA